MISGTESNLLQIEVSDIVEKAEQEINLQKYRPNTRLSFQVCAFSSFLFSKSFTLLRMIKLRSESSTGIVRECSVSEVLHRAKYRDAKY